MKLKFYYKIIHAIDWFYHKRFEFPYRLRKAAWSLSIKIAERIAELEDDHAES